jgi:hypothetical protein
MGPSRRVIAVVFGVALALRLILVFSVPAYDDAHITWRTARNLAAGHGIVYNVGERVQASTSPLYTLTSGAVWWLVGTGAPLLLRLLGAVADAGTAALIATLAAPLGGRLGSLLAGGVYALLSTVALPAVGGLETGLYTLAVAGACVAFSRRRLVAAASVAAVAALLRPDGLMLVAAVLAASAIRQPATTPRQLVAVVGLLGPWVVFATVYFGSPVPQTVTAKALVAHSAVEQWGFFLWKFFAGGPRQWLASALIGSGLVALARGRDDGASLCAAWGLIYVAAFSTAASWWPWYLPPAMVPYTLLLGIGGACLWQWAPHRRHARLATGLGVSAATLVAGGLVAQTALYARVTREAGPIYWEQRQAIVTWVSRCSPPGATVFLEPIGLVGFLLDRPIRDYPGLVSPDVTAALTPFRGRLPGTPTAPAALAAALAGVAPDVVILREGEYSATRSATEGIGYRLAHVVPADPGDTRRFPDFQRMFVLLRAASNCER